MSRRSAVLASLVLSLFAVAPAVAQSSRMPQPALTADQLAAFLKSHKGPVLDVRDDADCDVQTALKHTTHRLTFKWAPNDPEAKTAAHASFVSELRTNRTFVQVNRNQTPVLVVCCGGMRSQAAVEVLARNGFNVVTLNGGILKTINR